MSDKPMSGAERGRTHYQRQVELGLARVSAWVPADHVAIFRAIAEAEKAAYLAGEDSPLARQAAAYVPLAYGLRQALAELDDWLAWAESTDNVTKAEEGRQRLLVDRLRELACDLERKAAS